MTASTTSLSPPLQAAPATSLRPARDSFWTRIAAELAEAIGSGVYPPGQRLPSEHALAEQFGVNRHTIRRSLASRSPDRLASFCVKHPGRHCCHGTVGGEII